MNAPQNGHWRWRHGLLGGTGGNLSGYSATTLLDAQDDEHPMSTEVNAAKSKAGLAWIWQAETKADAERAFDLFIKPMRRYPKATTCLQKDREELLTFYEFQASIGRVFVPATRLIDLWHHVIAPNVRKVADTNGMLHMM